MEELVREYYSREDIIEALVAFARNREVAGRFASGGYSKRPDTLLHEGDVERLVATGIVSFHASVERWLNPLALETGRELRIGWDLLFDIDAENLEASRVAADMIIEALKAHGIKSIYLKFSGRAGFHIFVPWEAFDEKLKDAFPEVPRAIAAYIYDFVWEELPEKAAKDAKIDSIAIASRHLVRMPYSLNEKSWLVSIPVKDPWFELEDAKPEAVKAKPWVFKAKPREAMELVEAAMEFQRKLERREREKIIKEMPKKEGKRKKIKIPPEDFPPCVRNILKGLKDGRKRADFILRTFLRAVGWEWDEIWDLIMEWNKKNDPPLRENYLKAQFKWHRKQRREILPPNCNKEGFYKDMGVCTPDELCRQIRNPAGYAFKHWKLRRTGERQNGNDL